jgi:hypothetical protein
MGQLKNGGTVRNAYYISVVKPEWKRPHEKFRRRPKGNAKVDIKRKRYNLKGINCT